MAQVTGFVIQLARIFAAFIARILASINAEILTSCFAFN